MQAMHGRLGEARDYQALEHFITHSPRHHGYRPSKRYIVFQVLPDTLGLGPDVWRVLAKVP
jgi:hypothetical protein